VLLTADAATSAVPGLAELSPPNANDSADGKRLEDRQVVAEVADDGENATGNEADGCERYVIQK
jgi:hypothetical protein